MTTIITWLLELAHKLFDMFRGHINATQEAEIAKHAAEVLRMTAVGKELLHKIEEMHDEELDDWLKQLGRN